MYKAEITETFKELGARDKVKLKTSNDFQSLDTVIDDAGNEIVLEFENVVALHVLNDNSESKEYTKYIIIDAKGNKYSTGSESFYSSLMMIAEEMKEIGEETFEVRIFKRPSKNYAGRGFITCELA